MKEEKKKEEVLLWLRRREKPCLGVRLTERAFSRESESEPRLSFTPTLRSTSRTPLSDAHRDGSSCSGLSSPAMLEGGHQNSFGIGNLRNGKTQEDPGW